MRKRVRLVYLLSAAFFVTSLYAQSDRFAFAVTDLDKNGSGWNALRKLDLQTGEYSEVLLNGLNPSLVAYDAATKKAYQAIADARYGNYTQLPFSTGVAAMAYDKKNNRLYFTPMFIDQLRYIELRTMKIYYVTDQQFTKLGSMHNDEGKVITRMVIAPDGYGYAVSNDGQTFVRFSTNKKLKIEHLGSLVDAPGNVMSITSRCSSWGGDMIADDDGHLYIFSARNVMYKVDIESKVASLQSPITGLPNGFTINGAVVNEDNNILVSSAVDGKAWYLIDPKNWSATEFKSANGVYRSSDLANSNYLATRGRNNTPSGVSQRTQPVINDHIQLYPNPVTNDQFTIQFGKIDAGDYNIEMTDIVGRVVMRKMVNVSADGQVENVSLRSINAKGIYMINVFDANSRSVFNQKLVVQ